MEGINIYYKGVRLNNKPLTKGEAEEIKKKDNIFKRIDKKSVEKISTKDIEYRRCILV